MTAMSFAIDETSLELSLDTIRYAIEPQGAVYVDKAPPQSTSLPGQRTRLLGVSLPGQATEPQSQCYWMTKKSSSEVYLDRLLGPLYSSSTVLTLTLTPFARLLPVPYRQNHFFRFAN